MYLSRHGQGLKNETIANIIIIITLTLKAMKATGYREQRKH